MPELEILGAPQSNFVWVCRIAAAEKGVAVKLTPSRPHTPEVDAIHPSGKIPAMRHGDVTLFETLAICRYIDKAFAGPALVPADAKGAALADQWISYVLTEVDPVMVRKFLLGYFFPGTADGRPNRALIEPALPAIDRKSVV